MIKSVTLKKVCFINERCPKTFFVGSTIVDIPKNVH